MIFLTAFAEESAPPACLTLSLTWQERAYSRLQSRLSNGEEVIVMLPHGSHLYHGDRLWSDSGQVVAIEAAEESLLRVEAAQPLLLLRAAYHLGNRHTPLQVTEQYLLLPEEKLLAEMLRQLGCQVSAVRAPFEAERGAYAASHHHHGSADEDGHSAQIHEFA
ncbi:urease accessory protein UreE [Candidatus Magnetaquicoccus inordinatus]|uniref:urease accessory protein UreE n=1 Tax=Candidatus Magnetaquicoccus inordinatus TaxID=2496818 RepID=UPI00187D5229|nr:urease accessory protein UreE [Candidatus Magnetaquicoccus inordinatus]